MTADPALHPAKDGRPAFRGMIFLASLALPLYALDQATKWWIVRHFELYEHRPVIANFFDLVYYENTGAAFSAFSGKNTFFIGLSIVALVALIHFFRRGAFKDRPSRWAAGLLCAGILGNLTDRLAHGHVIDFLLFNLHVRFADPWPAFNVADSCICVATGLFIFSAIFERKPEALGGASN
jgi:signal peptidase II